MSRRIASLLGEPEHQVTKLISQLEGRNGWPSHDARLLAETIQKLRTKLQELDLDPDDTTPEELYHALQIKYENDSRLFDQSFAAEKLSFDEKTTLANKLLEPYAKQTNQWGLKNKAAKDVIRRLPPKRLMKYLNYRSVESMLKRENLPEMFLAAVYLESDTWLKAHRRLITRIGMGDFEIRSLSLVSLNPSRWSDIDGPSDFIARNEEMAALGIWPSEGAQKAPLLNIILLLADSIGQLTDIKASLAAKSMNSVLEWWADMDHLIAELSGEPVSMNLTDAALNHMKQKPYEKRDMGYGRSAFWRELISRYDNLPELDGLFTEPAMHKISGLKFAAPVPVYEFAEDA